MKMSVNENESLEIRLTNRRSNNSNIIDLEEELNRMERPSRVFSSRHHLSIPPVLTDTNNMEQNEQFRRSRDNSTYESLSSTTQNAGSTGNGDTARSRSPLVRFTITDPDTREMTVDEQIPLNNTPPNTQTSSLTSNNEVADDNDDSDDEYSYLGSSSSLSLHFCRPNIRVVQNFDYRDAPRLSGRWAGRFEDQPYYIVNTDFQNNPSSSTTNNRRVRLSTNRDNDDNTLDRSQTPEQELPEVLEHVTEPDNSDDQYDEVYPADVQESILSVSSHNDADSGDDRGSSHFSVSENHNTNADEENRDGTLDVTDETPRTRVVPFIMSPTSFSPQPESLDTPEISVTIVNNDLPDVPAALPLITNNDNNHGSTDYTIPGPSQLIYAVRSDIYDDSSVSRTIDFELDNVENETADNSARINEVNSIHDDSETIPINSHPSTVTRATHSNNRSKTTKKKKRAQVVKHPETYEDLNSQLLRLFECPVCFEHITPTVYQCLIGHIICNKCVLMCENCPTCRSPFSTKRNLCMEEVGYLLKYPCRNAVTGCKHQMFIDKKKKHEQECCYRHYQCFFTNCAWKGYYPELRSHMIKNHAKRILTGSEQFLDIILSTRNQTFKWFLSTENEYFAVIIHSTLPPRQVKIQVNFIGPTVKAKKFKFCIQLTQRSKARSGFSPKLVYERSTLPYSEIYEMSNDNGLIKEIFSLSGEMLDPFIKKMRCSLPVYLKVSSV